MNTIILFLLTAFYIKWLIFLLALGPIRLNNKKNQKKNLNNPAGGEKYPEVCSSRLRRSIAKYFHGYMRYFIFQVGLIPSHTIRNFIYQKILLVEMGKQSTLFWGAEIRAPYKLKIGKGSKIGDKALLDARNGIKIGENVNFSSNVSIYTEQHDHRDPNFSCNSDESFRVIINNRVWVGPNVIILHGVTIGEGAVIGAGAVVTKDIEPYCH